MSNYCAAVSAAIPLLILALMIEARAPAALARWQWQAMVKAIKKDFAVYIDERWVFERYRILLGFTLWGAVSAEAIALISIPFVPAGPPANGWQYLLLVITSGFAIWLFLLIAWILQRFIREVVHAEAAAAADKAPSDRQDDRG